MTSIHWNPTRSIFLATQPPTPTSAGPAAILEFNIQNLESGSILFRSRTRAFLLSSVLVLHTGSVNIHPGKCRDNQGGRSNTNLWSIWLQKIVVVIFLANARHLAQMWCHQVCSTMAMHFKLPLSVHLWKQSFLNVASKTQCTDNLFSSGSEFLLAIPLGALFVCHAYMTRRASLVHTLLHIFNFA